MYHHLCLPTDGSPLSQHAIEEGLAFARRLQARVTVLHVMQPYHVFAISPEQLALGSEADYQRGARASARELLEAIDARARAMGVDCDTVAIEDELPWQAIIATVNERGCDLIAMASHGRRGLSALVLGSETLKVLTHSAIPVLVYRQSA